jgi:hypothetical protein
MLVYIEELDEWFSGADTSIMLVLANQEKAQIANMPRSHERFLQSPIGTSNIKQQNLLQKKPPPSDLGGGLSDLDVDGIASVEGPDDD